ncbi:MAG: sugar phosphate isomerase/epimerase family protein [Thermoguttaceae bacterium]
MNRRAFLAATAAGAGLAAAGGWAGAAEKAPNRKALIGLPVEETLRKMKDAGFDGLELDIRKATPEMMAEAPKIAEKTGIRIHSILRGWMDFNSSDMSVVERDVATVEESLRAGQRCGASAILLVPCKIGGMAMPAPGEFDVEIDEKTGHLGRVVAGDNAPYGEYIAAHDHAVDASRKAIERLIPTAEKTGVAIAIENVGNNLWRLPGPFGQFLASFDSPWVRAYFDVANHGEYAPAEEWIRTLGKLTVKVHIKDWKRTEEGKRRSADIRDGDIAWPAVHKALGEVGYRDWFTIEGSGGLSYEEQSRRLDLILAGK